MTHGLMLARGKLADGGFFVIVVKRCLSGHCHELDEYVEEPARYSGVPGSIGLVKEGGETGPEIGRRSVLLPVRRVNHRYRVLMELKVSHACAGPNPYALAYGMLYRPGASITAHADGLTLKFKGVTIPARLHPGGVLVYALLPPGKNELVVREPNGQVVAREPAYGPKARASCRE